MKAFRCLASLIAGAAMLAVMGTTAVGQEGGGAGGAPAKLLFLTHSQGFKHSSLPVAERVVVELGRKSGLFEATVLEGYKQERDAIDLRMISPDYLKAFAVVMFFTTGELPLDDAQKEALLAFVRGGKAFVGVHSATDTYYEWPGYGEMIGGYFKTHGANDEVLVLRIEDKLHPATRMLGDTWPLADEYYQFGRGEAGSRGSVPLSRDRVRVLISVDTERSTMGRQAGMTKGGDYPLAWCRDYGQGRVFYTALGHREDVWTNLTFQAHLLGGLRWALGLEPGDATPRGETSNPGR